MTRAPKKPKAPIMSGVNVMIITSQSLIMTGIAFGVYILAIKFGLGGIYSLKHRCSKHFTAAIACIYLFDNDATYTIILVEISPAVGFPHGHHIQQVSHLLFLLIILLLGAGSGGTLYK
jgi:predicted transporter